MEIPGIEKLSHRTKQAITKLQKLHVFSIQDIVALGLPLPTFKRLIKQDIFHRRSSGVYVNAYPERLVDLEELDFMIACRKFQSASIGLLSVVSGGSRSIRVNFMNFRCFIAVILYELKKQPPSRHDPLSKQ